MMPKLLSCGECTDAMRPNRPEMKQKTRLGKMLTIRQSAWQIESWRALQSVQRSDHSGSNPGSDTEIMVRALMAVRGTVRKEMGHDGEVQTRHSSS